MIRGQFTTGLFLGQGSVIKPVEIIPTKGMYNMFSCPLFFRVLKLLRKEKSENTKQIKNKIENILREEKEIMNRWKEYLEQLLNVKFERQIDDEKEDIME